MPPRTAADQYRLPWPIRAVNRMFEPVAARLWPVTPADLVQRARARTGLTDFGDVAPFAEPLEVLCGSANEEVDLSVFGRITVRQRLIQRMTSRLRLTDLAAQRPEIFEEAVTAPVFVSGTPRSGTTFLHRTMARDQAWHSLPLWEVLDPIPAGGPSRGPGPDPRIRAGERLLRTTTRFFPGLLDSHEMANDEPEEELPLLDAAFITMEFGSGALPAFSRWYAEAEHGGGYRLLRQYLQAMQSGRPGGGRWLLKSPTHLEMLSPLLEVFDDATVVLTHRDPVASVISLAAMGSFSTAMMMRHPDRPRSGQVAADYIERSLRSMVDYRDSAEGMVNGHRFVDVAFGELIADPIGVVQKVSSAAGRLPDDAALTGMRAYLDRADGHRSKQRFAAEHFGLDVKALRERFGFYYERFDVPVERD